ncbi:MAG: hypothetical protein LBR41_01985 [Rickettsiales bacterium]|nr:hypothetical protein [Rickettsiales bacterium]
MKKIFSLFVILSFCHSAISSDDGIRTIDWDGVPLWDDSLPDSDNMDFYDDFEYNVRDVTVKTVDAPLSSASALDTVIASAMMRKTDYTAIKPVCPFRTEMECAIWARKPMYVQTMGWRSSILSDAAIDRISVAACAGDFSVENPAYRILFGRYRTLMSAARACCTSGMVTRLRDGGATDDLLYKFMVDDANFYQMGDRCLMTSDADLDERKFPNSFAEMAGDARNTCLCRQRDWFRALLAPFVQAWDAVPEFASNRFDYKYRDGLNREVTVSINYDVQNVLDQIDACP